MRILTIVFNLNKGGTQRAAQIFAEAYKKLGHDSRILTLYGLGSRFEEIKDDFKIWQGVGDSNLKEIKEWNPEVIHIHSHGPKAEDISRLFDFLPIDKIKIIEQNVFSKPSPWMDRVDISFQLSDWAYWLYMLRGGDMTRATIIPYPIISDRFTNRETALVSAFKVKYNIPEEAFVIGRIGQSEVGKWSLMLIDIFNRLAKKYTNLYLVVVNPPANIVQAISRSNYKNRIRHIEKINGDENLSIAYSSFDLMLHIAEMGESFGYALVESILCGTPVVALSTPWGDNSQGEVVFNGVGGYVANSRKALIQTVAKYINREIIHEADIARQNIIKRYDYLLVTQKALDSLKTERKMDKQELNVKIINILKNTVDKTKMLTVFLIKMNCLLCRKLTAYQYHWPTLFRTLVRKISQKIYVRKN
ncbi:glycosyltransferase family 4 protein [Patescibacteria group bacterium]|nr:glycosyltransferase family 4 protein [Patescibacteria group bacterium]